MCITPRFPTGDLFRWAVASHQFHPGGLSTAAYAWRLAVCEECQFHRRGRCLICGCALAERAQNPTADCPHYVNRWQEVLDSGRPDGGQ